VHLINVCIIIIIIVVVIVVDWPNFQSHHGLGWVPHRSSSEKLWRLLKWEFFTCQMPFLMPNRWCKSTEGTSNKQLNAKKLNLCHHSTLPLFYFIMYDRCPADKTQGLQHLKNIQLTLCVVKKTDFN